MFIYVKHVITTTRARLKDFIKKLQRMPAFCVRQFGTLTAKKEVVIFNAQKELYILL